MSAFLALPPCGVDGRLRAVEPVAWDDVMAKARQAHMFCDPTRATQY